MAVDEEQWAKNLCNPGYPSSIKVTTSKKIPYPPDFQPTNNSDKEKHTTDKKRPYVDIDALQVQKAWQIALQPLKSIPMNFVMSYMSGTSLQIIPIMTALMLLSGPIKSIFSIRQAFNPVLGNAKTESTIRGAMLLYIVGQCVLMYIGLRKLNQMGLIPNTNSDWLAWEPHINYNGNNIKSVVI